MDLPLEVNPRLPVNQYWLERTFKPMITLVQYWGCTWFKNQTTLGGIFQTFSVTSVQLGAFLKMHAGCML